MYKEILKFLKDKNRKLTKEETNEFIKLLAKTVDMEDFDPNLLNIDTEDYNILCDTGLCENNIYIDNSPYEHNILDEDNIFGDNLECDCSEEDFYTSEDEDEEEDEYVVLSKRKIQRNGDFKRVKTGFGVEVGNANDECVFEENIVNHGFDDHNASVTKNDNNEKSCADDTNIKEVINDNTIVSIEGIDSDVKRIDDILNNELNRVNEDNTSNYDLIDDKKMNCADEKIKPDSDKSIGSELIQNEKFYENKKMILDFREEETKKSNPDDFEKSKEDEDYKTIESFSMSKDYNNYTNNSENPLFNEKPKDSENLISNVDENLKKQFINENSEFENNSMFTIPKEDIIINKPKFEFKLPDISSMKNSTFELPKNPQFTTFDFEFPKDYEEAKENDKYKFEIGDLIDVQKNGPEYKFYDEDQQEI